MATLNMKKWIETILSTPQRVAIPIMTHPGIELIGKKVVDAVTNGETHFEAIKALYDQYPSAATTVIMDLTVEAEAFGCTIVFPDNEVPSVTGRLLSNKEEVEQLAIPSLDKGRIPEYLKANRLTAAYVKDKPVLSGCIGPFSLAGRLYDMTEIMMAIYIEPETIQLLLDKCTEFLISYILELKKTGVNGIVIAEPASGLLSDNDCRNYSSVYVKKIIDAVQDDSFAVILHNCGNTGHCTKAMVDSGAACYHFGNKIDMLKALEECPSDVLVMGNLDPVSVFKQMNAVEVYKATKELLKKTEKYKNFVLSSGCDTPPHVPLANINAFYQALEECNQ